jgi:hypothetical protein
MMPSGPRLQRALTATAIAAVALSGCAKTAEVAVKRKEPVKVEKVAGSEFKRMTLQPEAATRIGIKTEKVAALHRFGGQTERTTVPYGAVLYNAKGATWVYTNPEPLVFVGHPVTVDYLEGDVAVLVKGPPVGTSVVTDGGSELTGVEFGVGK